MVRYNTSYFDTCFGELGLEEGDTLLIHSSLFSFGLPTDLPLGSLPEKIYSSLLKAVGPKGTIVVPTFNFDFCKGRPFNRQRTPSKRMGVFSEYIRNLDNSQRSFHPAQSIAAIGRHKDYIVENDTESAFGPHGPFDRLYNLNTKVILLGSSINSASVIHWVEEKQKVPYRFWKPFSGTYVDQDRKDKKTYKMYVRSSELNAQLSLDYIEKRLLDKNSISSVTIGSGTVCSFALTDFVSIAEECINMNPYFFVSNHPKFEQLLYNSRS